MTDVSLKIEKERKKKERKSPIFRGNFPNSCLFLSSEALGSDPGYGLQLHYAAFILQRTMPQSAVRLVDKKNTSFDR